LTIRQPPNYEVRVNDTEPIFFYCAAPGSCVNYHMIGVINPNATQTFDAQLAFAENATYQLAPGDPFPSETPIPKPTPGSGPSDPNSNSGRGGGGGSLGYLSPGAIAGIAIGAAAVLIPGTALIYLHSRRHGFEKARRESAQRRAAPASPPMMVVVPSSANPSSPWQTTPPGYEVGTGREYELSGGATL
jgi:hypothetical protein